MEEEIKDEITEEVEESVTDNTPNVEEEEPEIEEVEEPQTELTVEDYRKLEATNKKLYARLKKVEEEAKKLVVKEPLINQEQIREELVLIAKGEDEEVIDKAKAFAKSLNISLKDALSDPAIVAFKEKKAEENKRKSAQLGSSGRSIASKELEVKPNMDRDEHRALWKKMTGN
jgi:hypothetical protein